MTCLRCRRCNTPTSYDGTGVCKDPECRKWHSDLCRNRYNESRGSAKSYPTTHFDHEMGRRVPNTKCCTRCGLNKPYQEFPDHPRKDRKFGCKRSQCKTCWKESRYEEHKKHKDKHPVWWLLKGAQYRAKRKGIPFDITIEDLMPFPTHCPVFGTELAYTSDVRQRAMLNSASLDRFDPNKGYVKGNVNIISHHANSIKNQRTSPEEVRDYCDNLERLAKQGRVVAEWMEQHMNESSLQEPQP